MDDKNISTCINCRFGTRDEHDVNCRRFPESIIKNGNDWCGEFKHTEEFLQNYYDKYGILYVGD